jgi:hypothetical protein
MSKILKASQHVGRDGDWNLDEGVTVHEQFAGLTACRRAVGTRQRGWLSQEAWAFDVTCKQCRKAIESGAY